MGVVEEKILIFPGKEATSEESIGEGGKLGEGKVLIIRVFLGKHSQTREKFSRLLLSHSIYKIRILY